MKQCELWWNSGFPRSSFALLLKLWWNEFFSSKEFTFQTPEFYPKIFIEIVLIYRLKSRSFKMLHWENSRRRRKFIASFIALVGVGKFYMCTSIWEYTYSNNSCSYSRLYFCIVFPLMLFLVLPLQMHMIIFIETLIE